MNNDLNWSNLNFKSISQAVIMRGLLQTKVKNLIMKLVRDMAVRSTLILLDEWHNRIISGNTSKEVSIFAWPKKKKSRKEGETIQ